jgi:uncharacterized protein YjbI with pentapeptide repeats
MKRSDKESIEPWKEGLKPDNVEQILALKQGVSQWKRFKKKHNIDKPDLNGANLQNVDLRRANLSNANLSEANLSGANLSGANLSGANLSKADISYANLSNTDLTGARLKHTSFIGSNFSEAKFDERTDIFGADFGSAKLAGVNLSKIKFSGSDLSYADLEGANLSYANLEGANLTGAYLMQANLTEANLTGADFRYSTLRYADLTGTRFLNVPTYNWDIEGVKCDYIFLDYKKEIRAPKDRNFDSGEFEKLHRSVPTFEMVFEEGMNFLDPAILAYIAKRNNLANPKLGLALQTINLKGLKPSAVFEISEDALTKETERKILKERQEVYASPSKLLDIIKDLTETVKHQALSMEKRKISAVNYYEGSTHNEKVIGNKANFGNTDTGILQKQLEELKTELQSLSEDVKNQISFLINMPSLPKEQKEQSIKAILLNHGLSIANNFSSSALWAIINTLNF